ncbi:Helix-turn-helix domain-containing protein [Treponema bryantii]|uniref:Helix-turn-helix domain-containing protein n=1 Tax=Treponema bryantii TaxID=163 RepID=A0A1H9B4F8_9SPIR|nr:helix-turn-helix domain-containing protein [Treponema bryantii]SEP83719.1 Helix-turn-helix domain-containing protein [Treponema bryantii]
MPVEEIIKELSEQKRIISDAQKRQEELVQSLISANEKEWDLISVAKASQKSGLSVTTIYRFINSGKLHCVHKGALKYISSKELENLDDKRCL